MVKTQNKCWRKVVRGNGDIYFQTDLDKPYNEQKMVNVSKRKIFGEKKTDYIVFSADKMKGYNVGEFKTKGEALKVAYKETQRLKKC